MGRLNRKGLGIRKMATKTKNEKPGLKAALENHPLLVTVSAISLLINAAVGGWKGYETFFGERAVLVEEYVQVPVEIAEHVGYLEESGLKRTGKLEPYKCGILDNELRHAYLAAQKAPGARPSNVRIAGGAEIVPQAVVIYLVVRNSGATMAKEVALTGTRLDSPYSIAEQGDGPPSEAESRGLPDYVSLVGLSGRLTDDNPKPLRANVGSLRPGECAAVPMAIYQPDAGDGEFLPLATPLLRFDSLEYRRSFGWRGERQSVRPMNNTAVTIDAVVKGLG
jgi:hypothetical protein